jgi:hypothetical protein
MNEEMKELYTEGIASHAGPEPGGGARKVCRNTLSVSSNAAPPASVRLTLWSLRRRGW